MPYFHDEGGVPIYVELKLYQIGDSDRLKIISIHDSGGRMNIREVIHDDCPHCEAMRSIEIVNGRETTKIRGEDADLSAARAVYRERHGIIGPEELVALRRRYDVSQKSFAKILDIGDLTINSYEQGALPSGAHNSLLRLAEETANFRRLYQANKAGLSERQRAKIERALAALGLAERSALETRETPPPCGVVAAPVEIRILQLIPLLLA
ncbi:MAG: hypothetical protein M0Z80_10185 [Treponema sp.]|nr:hypothetical protein [Treponema sp.]